MQRLRRLRRRGLRGHGVRRMVRRQRGGRWRVAAEGTDQEEYCDECCLGAHDLGEILEVELECGAAASSTPNGTRGKPEANGQMARAAQAAIARIPHGLHNQIGAQRSVYPNSAAWTVGTRAAWDVHLEVTAAASVTAASIASIAAASITAAEV